MLQSIIGDAILGSEWREQIWRFRHKHFVERLGWEGLRKPDGLEIDEFDTNDAIHLALICDRTVVGYSRLLPTTKPHLLSDVYPEVAGGNDYPKGPLVYEWTRCIAEPEVSIAGVLAANMLLTGVLEYCLVVGIEALIVETHPKLVNLLVSTGWDVMPFAAPSTLSSGLIVPICAKPLPFALTISHEQQGINGSVLELPENGRNPLTGRPLLPFLQPHKQSSEVSEYA
ncbi:acyl-homoserine-lactone synthase [Agrobacterium sp. BA1120]|uniref:acyl-homoserine-lactone synthase n=1 Tax=Agrobacterium sp. BA1120 TaxID=3228927 RepID=UPI00336A5662